MATKEALLPAGEAPSLGTIAWHFAVLGCTAFGGPPVHLGMFQTRLVEKLGWLSGTRYAELIAMANCLPGPSSTQVAFAIGITQQGTAGGLVSGFCFLVPGAILMTLLGFVSASLQSQIEQPDSIANGVASAASAVGVALVLVAVTQLVKKTADGPLLGAICFGVAAVCLFSSPQPPWLNPVLILAGGLVTGIFPVAAGAAAQSEEPEGKTGLPTALAACIFALYFVVAAYTIYDAAVDKGWLIPFLTAGMFVWGGGPVVLPMLMAVLTPAWIPHTIFLTGIALAEMMPGPVFNMACFLGVQLSLNNGFPWLLGTFLCWLFLAGPGITLTFGAMPLWGKLRSFEAYRRALPGLNAAAVGLLVSTIFFVYDALEARSPWPAGSRALALCAYAAIEYVKLDIVLVVVVASLLGSVWAYVHALHGL